MKGNSKKLAQRISVVFSFFLSLTLFLLFVFLGLGSSLFNDRILLSKMKESNYYNGVQKEVYAKAEEIVTGQGFPSSVIEPVITLKRVYISGQNYLEQVLSGKEVTIDTQSLGTDLEAGMKSYLEEEKITLTEELEEGVNEIVKKVENQYKRSIQFSFVNVYVQYKQSYKALLKWMVPVFVLLILFQVFLLFKIQRYPHRGVRYVNYGVMGATWMTFFLFFTLVVTKFYEYFSFTPTHYGDFVEGYLKWTLHVCFYFGCFGVMLILFLSALMNYLKKRVQA